MIILELIQGLAILAKYVKANEDGFSVSHDQIWAGPEDADAVTPEDKAALLALDWFVEEDSYSHFC